MTTILTSFGAGGANLTPSGSSGEPDLATTLRDIADDLGAINTALAGANITAADPAAITAADPSAALAAFTDPPSAGEMAALRTLVNELRTLSIDLKARLAEYRTLALELKTDVSAATGGTLKTIKG